MLPEAIRTPGLGAGDGASGLVRFRLDGEGPLISTVEGPAGGVSCELGAGESARFRPF